MDLTDFNWNYLNKLLENISEEQKSIFPLGDFNSNFLNYNEHNQTNEFLDSVASNSFIPSLMEFQVRYLALFLLFSVIDGFGWFWMGRLPKNIQLMLDFLKGPF